MKIRWDDARNTVTLWLKKSEATAAAGRKFSIQTLILRITRKMNVTNDIAA